MAPITREGTNPLVASRVPGSFGPPAAQNAAKPV